VDPYQGFDEFVTAHTTALSRMAFLLTGAYRASLDSLAGFTAPLHPLLDGSVLLQLWRSYGGSPAVDGTLVPTDVLVLDLDAGVVRERWRLPEPRPLSDNPRGGWESWTITAVRPEGLLLTHAFTQGRWTWELYDRATGTLSLVTDLRGLATGK